MPVRRRVPKARPIEIEMWRMMFTAGFDFFNDLEPLGYASEAEAQAQALCMQTNDFKRAFDAFVEKRKPVFEGN